MIGSNDILTNKIVRRRANDIHNNYVADQMMILVRFALHREWIPVVIFWHKYD